ncbi:MAG: hypothetical protein ACYTE8_04100, partial [Planctomycetota bacterium]
MKEKKNNFERNISRLVKLAGDKDKPSEKFSDSVIENALDELQQPAKDPKRVGRNKTMKLMRMLSYAAAVIITAGVIFSIVIPNLNRSKIADKESNLRQLQTVKVGEDKIETDMIVAKDDSDSRKSEWMTEQIQTKAVEEMERKIPESSSVPSDKPVSAPQQEIALGVEYTKGVSGAVSSDEKA